MIFFHPSQMANFHSSFQFASLLRCAPVAGFRFASFAPAHVALRAAFGRQCWFAFFPGYTFDSFAPAQLALRANLRLVYLELPRRSRFTLRAAIYAAYRAKAQFAWFPASPRWHVFRFQISSFRYFSPPPVDVQPVLLGLLAK